MPKTTSFRVKMEYWQEQIDGILPDALGVPDESIYVDTSYAWDPEPGDEVNESAEAKSDSPELALTAQRRLDEAMRYVLLASGKRLRPMLYLAVRELLGESDELSEIDRCFLSSIEMIHNYSLVHDDLPAMDNDDYRRGRLSCHRAFDEATAILAGDALLNRALELLIKGVSLATPESMPQVVKAAGLVAERAGTRGMIGGQMIDLLAEDYDVPSKADEAYKGACLSLEQIQKRKTAALIEAPILAAAYIYEAPQEIFMALRQYAKALGIAYQIEDDLLDLVGNAKTIGKSTGKDEEAGKWTAVTLYGNQVRTKLDEVLSQATEALDRIDDADNDDTDYDTNFLRELAVSSAKRIK